MLKIAFKNLDKSQLASDIVTERFELLLKKFPDLEDHNIEVYLSMENSPSQVGRDFFAVNVVFTGKKYGKLVVEKKNINLYVALDDLLLVMQETLNRKGDKVRVRRRTSSRKQKLTYAI